MAYRSLYKFIIKKYYCFEKKLSEKPFVTTLLSSGVILGVGEIVMQLIERYKLSEEKRKTWSLSRDRVYNMVIFGTVYSFFISYYWYVKLLPRLTYAKGQSQLKMSLKKVFLDQSIQSSIYTASFLYCMTRQNGGTHIEGSEKIKKEFLRVFIMDQKIWPLTQLINFYFIPLRYQIFVIEIVNVFWSAYLSFVEQDNKENEIEKDIEKERD